MRSTEEGRALSASLDRSTLVNDTEQGSCETAADEASTQECAAVTADGIDPAGAQVSPSDSQSSVSEVKNGAAGSAVPERLADPKRVMAALRIFVSGVTDKWRLGRLTLMRRLSDRILKLEMAVKDRAIAESRARAQRQRWVHCTHCLIFSAPHTPSVPLLQCPYGSCSYEACH